MPASEGYGWGRGSLIGLGAVALAAVAAVSGAGRPDPLLEHAARAAAEAPPADEAPAAPVPGEAVEQREEVAGLIPPYPGATSVPMGGFAVNGNATQMAAFQTTDDPERVLGWYAEAFASQGHRVEQHGDDRVAMVSYYDAQAGSMVSVMTMRDRAGQVTLGFPSVTDVAEGLSVGTDPPPDLPAPPGAMVVMGVADTQGHPSTTYTQIQQGLPVEVAGFYRTEMAKRGFAATTDRVHKDTALLVFEKAPRRVQVSVTPLAEWKTPPESMAAIVVEEVR